MPFQIQSHVTPKPREVRAGLVAKPLVARRRSPAYAGSLPCEPSHRGGFAVCLQVQK